MSTAACLLLYFSQTDLLPLVNITTGRSNVRSHTMSLWPLFLIASVLVKSQVLGDAGLLLVFMNVMSADDWKQVLENVKQ